MLFFAVVLIAATLSLDNGLGRTPPMGWNSWNTFGCRVTEADVRGAADSFLSLGLDKLGYRYVNVDDCWCGGRDANGIVYADNASFPSGMKKLADYIHSKGLLAGIYSDAGSKTCAGRPGNLGHEEQDAKTFAAWGYDYLKDDNCHNEGVSPKKRYPIMRDALNATGRPIYFSMCEWGEDSPWDWAGEVANCWRTTGDIQKSWSSMLSNLDLSSRHWKSAHPGAFNDPDMLEIGTGALNLEEERSHFSLWSIMKSPLLIGCDLTTVASDSLSILTNPEVIAVNQDPLGIQGHVVHETLILKTHQVWAGPLADGSVAVVLFNRGDKSEDVAVPSWKTVGLDTQNASVRDLWAHAELGVHGNGFSMKVASHGVAMLKVTPVK